MTDLSDEELDDLAGRATSWLPAPSETPVNESVMAMLAVRAVAELRRRRQADLSEAERSALAFAWGILSAIHKQGRSEHGTMPHALAVLDKLLAASSHDPGATGRE